MRHVLLLVGVAVAAIIGAACASGCGASGGGSASQLGPRVLVDEGAFVVPAGGWQERSFTLNSGHRFTVSWTVGGGNGDVNVTIHGPAVSRMLPRTLDDAVTFDVRSGQTGRYSFRFGNEFSVITDKTVRFKLEAQTLPSG